MSARLSHFIRAPPCCAVSRFISQRVRVIGEAGSRQCVSVSCSHGPTMPAFCRYRPRKLVIYVVDCSQQSSLSSGWCLPSLYWSSCRSWSRCIHHLLRSSWSLPSGPCSHIRSFMVSSSTTWKGWLPKRCGRMRCCGSYSYGFAEEWSLTHFRSCEIAFTPVDRSHQSFPRSTHH